MTKDQPTTQPAIRYADQSMYQAAPMASRTPEVHLLWMTPDPLGAIAAACRMYEGKPTYDLVRDVSDNDRRNYWEQVKRTHLKAPLEFVKFHFFIEGVDRAFTHQLVRQRTAVYAQESLRFAVKHDLAADTSVPPSLLKDTKQARQAKEVWDETVVKIEETYNYLVANGIPAEDARGLMPHSILTRLNYCTDLRSLLDHAGNRLCTQAQFHWRLVFQGIMKAIADYLPDWEWELMSDVFKPVCYEQGRCPFQADFDRGCTIRERADRGAFDQIKDEEWMLDPKAAWL